MSNKLTSLLDELDRRIQAVTSSKELDDALNRLILIIDTIKSPDTKNAQKIINAIKKKTTEVEDALIKTIQYDELTKESDALHGPKRPRSLKDILKWAHIVGKTTKTENKIGFTQEDKNLVLKKLGELNKMTAALQEAKETTKMHDYKEFTAAATILSNYLIAIQGMVGSGSSNPLGKLIQSLRARRQI